MGFKAVEKDRHMCTFFRYFKSFSQLYYILTSDIVVSWAYTVGGIDDDNNIKMFVARFWRRRLWGWTLKKTKTTRWQIDRLVKLKEETIMRKESEYT